MPEYDILSAISVVLKAQNAPKSLAAGGSAPDPTEGAHDIPPYHRRLERRQAHSLDPSILSAYNASILASDMCPSKQNRGYATEWVVMGGAAVFISAYGGKTTKPSSD